MNEQFLLDEETPEVSSTFPKTILYGCCSLVLFPITFIGLVEMPNSTPDIFLLILGLVSIVAVLGFFYCSIVGIIKARQAFLHQKGTTILQLINIGGNTFLLYLWLSLIIDFLFDLGCSFGLDRWILGLLIR